MSQRLDEIIDSILNRDSKADVETLVVAAHLAQMKTFGIRQGVELYPQQDDPSDSRSEFILATWKANKLDTHLDRIWDLTLAKGSLLFYLRPTQSGYRLHYFYGHRDPGKSQFRAYYDAEGELSEVVIIYYYRRKSTLDLPDSRRWVKLRMTRDSIYQQEMDLRPTFDDDIAVEPIPNPLGIVPCVIIRNCPMEDNEGADEFSWLDSQICSLDANERAMTENIAFFGNPMLVSTRSASEVLEARTEQRSLERPSIASQNGFVGVGAPSTRYTDASNRQAGLRVRKVVGGVESDERFGFINPDPVTPDQTRFVAEKREMIRTALGGVDELGISAGATAFEIKSLYGRAAATANKKAQIIYNHGLCELFSLAIAIEEQLFRNTMASALKMDPLELSDYFISEYIQTKGVPEGVQGLMPNGDRTVLWRFVGPVFEDSPRDLLQKSIVGRNLREEGVNREEVFRFLYPDKTKSEIKRMITGGFPYRDVQNVAQATQQLLGLQQQLLSMPDPADPSIPLGAVLNLTPLLEASLMHISQEINDKQQFTPADPNVHPTIGESITRGKYVPTGLPAATSSASVPAGAGIPAANVPNPNVPGTYSGYGYANPASFIPGYIEYGSGNVSGVASPGNESGVGESMEASLRSGGRSIITPGRFAVPGQTTRTESSLTTLNNPAISADIQSPRVDAAADPASIWSQLFPAFTSFLSGRNNSTGKQRGKK